MTYPGPITYPSSSTYLGTTPVTPLKLLTEGQYQIGTDVVFGAGTVYPVEKTEFGAPDVVTGGGSSGGDVNLPRADGLRFGRDYRGGRQIVIALNVLTGSSSSLDALGLLEQAWLADDVRTIPGAVTTLRYCRGGRTRRVYGRPRKFAAVSTHSAHGWTPVTATFHTVDHRFYDDVETSNGLTIVPPRVLGYSVPVTVPWVSTGVAERPGIVQVGGSSDAWLVLVITGPITNPTVDVVGEWKLDFTLTLGVGETLAVDPRPWQRTVLKNGVANVAGSLTASSPRLSGVKVGPGAHQIVLRGVDPSGTARLSYAWSSAWSSF